MILRPLTLIGIILSIVTGLAMGIGAHLRWTAHKADDPSQMLNEVLREVEHSYVTEVSREKLLEYAIEGVMNRLDEYSDYLDSGSFESLQTTTSGRFGGIGIELGLVDGYFTVVSPMDDTPASRADLKPGDRITGVGGQPVKGKKLKQLVKMLRGAPGSEVELSITREGQETFDVVLIRSIIRIASVRSRMLEPGYGYLRISQFQANTSKDVGKAIEALSDAANGDLHGVVLDLRNNPGGTLQASVEVADHFLNQGLIVLTRGRLLSSHAKYRATQGDKLAGVPMVVLINSGSASASEIVAAALQDHDRATLLGTQSYGKGSVQTLLPLNGEQALKLTTAYYYTPDGTSIHGKGIAPDVQLDLSEELLLTEAVQYLKTSAHPQHVYLAPTDE